jgi:hypothetical protein
MTTLDHIGISAPAVGTEATLPRRRWFYERRDVEARARLEQRVLAEFREMPCLRLTPAQAERLFGLRPDVSRRVLARLIQCDWVRVDDEGRYAVTSP